MDTNPPIKRHKKHRSNRHKKSKSKRRKKHKRSKRSGSPRGLKPKCNLLNPKQQQVNTDHNKSSDLPIITEEDLEDGSFSDSYIPTRYDASGFFSYHTWDNENASCARPPDEDRIVRSGPSLWHWSWDLSFGLYDELYDTYKKTLSNKSSQRDMHLELEETWLNMEGPIPSWQPLFAAMIWFIISMYILFPVSMIAQSATCLSNGDSSSEHSDCDVHISNSYAHLSVGLILIAFEITSWLFTPVSCFLIFRVGPSWMLFIGITLMITSAVCMAFTWQMSKLQFILLNFIFRMIGGIGFNIVRQSTLFVWSCFAKLDMLASGLGFCVGPVLGDLLYTYASVRIAYMVYASLLVILLLILSFIILFNLLSVQQISQFEIPNQIKNIRKPRYDIWHVDSHSILSKLHVWFKLEVVCITIIGLTAFEPILPVDPRFKITVSGSLFTFIYLPLLALSALLGLIFAKSSSKLLSAAGSPKKHVKRKRRGMKYITKTLSINLSGINVSKSEQIKLVEDPSWLTKKKRLLPSPDISQHHLMLLFGLFAVSFGWNLLSGLHTLQVMSNSSEQGVRSVLGLVIISIGSSFILVSCVDCTINGIILSLNQTQLTYRVINVSILCGPLIGGLMLDLNHNSFSKPSKYVTYIITAHFAVYALVLIMSYMYKCVRHFCKAKKVKTHAKRVQMNVNQNEDNTLPLIRDLSFGKIDPSMHADALTKFNKKNENVSIEVVRCNDVKRHNEKRVKRKRKEVYIYGTDLRHLCWWKRGLNVRFPYVQWLESGWSSTHQQQQPQVKHNDSNSRLQLTQ